MSEVEPVEDHIDKNRKGDQPGPDNCKIQFHNRFPYAPGIKSGST